MCVRAALAESRAVVLRTVVRPRDPIVRQRVRTHRREEATRARQRKDPAAA